MLPDIKILIVKYLTGSATTNDLDTLAEWIENPKNKKVFKEYVEIHYSVFCIMKEPNTQKVINKLLSTIQKEKSFVYKLKKYSVYKYAAALLVIGLMIFVSTHRRNDKENFEEPILINNEEVIMPGFNKAILTLDDGSQVALEKGEVFNNKNFNSNGDKISYQKGKLKAGEIKYNYLTIPRGGQFFLELSDGTLVWLNSESQLKYPVNFNKGETRKVELVYGEAFFDVSPSIDHSNSSFVVINKSQEVEVLGTEFNIKAYLGESNIYTTLVEGKVSVSSGLETRILKPSQQLHLNLENNTKTIKTVDVYNEIAWKEGVFSFENKSLKDMMIVLSRWYDVDVIFKNKTIQNEEFIGVLRKNQELHEILTIIKNFGIIKNYNIYDKKVVLE